MGRTWAIIERELRRFRRSPILIVVSMVFPLVQLIILGYAFGGNVKHLKLAIVDHGELKALDSPLKLKASIPGKNSLEVSFANAPPDWQERIERLPGVESVTAHDDVFRIATGSGPQTTLALVELAAAAGVTIGSLSVQSTSLDDVFVHYTGRALRDALQDANPLDRGPMLRRA